MSSNAIRIKVTRETYDEIRAALAKLNLVPAVEGVAGLLKIGPIVLERGESR